MLVINLLAVVAGRRPDLAMETSGIYQERASKNTLVLSGANPRATALTTHKE